MHALEIENFFLELIQHRIILKIKYQVYLQNQEFFSSPCSIELYAEIFDQENALNKLESFASINGPIFYKLPVNKNKIKIMKKKWILNEYTTNNKVKIKNFYGGQELNWKVL